MLKLKLLALIKRLQITYSVLRHGIKGFVRVFVDDARRMSKKSINRELTEDLLIEGFIRQIILEISTYYFGMDKKSALTLSRKISSYAMGELQKNKVVKTDIDYIV